MKLVAAALSIVVTAALAATPALAAKKKAAKADAAAPAKDEAAEEAKAETDVVDDEEAAPAEAEQREVKYGGAEIGEVVGGATGFVFKRGFYTQSDLGGYFRLFGYTDQTDNGVLCVRCKAVYYSNLQPYIGLSVGYDVLDFLAVQASLGSGFVANAAPVEADPNSPRDYGMIFTNIALVPSWNFFDRYVLMGKVFAGGAFLTPPPQLDAPFYGGDVGVGLGVQYATLLTDVIIGFEVNSFVSIFPDGGGGVLFIPAFNFAPVIKYVF
jgi:hypothetical protein